MRAAAFLPAGTVPARGTVVVLGGLAGVAGYAVLLTWAMATRPYDLWGALVVGPLLVAVTFALVARLERQPGMVALLVLGLLLRFGGAIARYLVAFDLYGGRADAGRYISQGKAFAEAVASGVAPVVDMVGGEGARFVGSVSGVVFTLVGPTELGAFLVFAWMGFLGIYLLYRAALLAVPAAPHGRYVLLLLFAPSLIFWPSSIGKEAWMLLGLGVAALGVARVVERRRGGYASLALGLVALLAVRPHIAAMVALAVFVALLRRRWRTRPTAARRIGQLLRVAAAAAVAVATLVSAQQFLGFEELSLEGIESALAANEERTTGGGSEFKARPVTSPGRLPGAVATVLFRPFPHETHNTQALLTSLEGVAILLLVVAGAGRLLRLPVTAWREPYVLFACTFVMLFVVAFSSIGNFGILARQRAQVLPFVMLLLFARPRTTEVAP